MTNEKLNKISDYAYSTRETIYSTYALAKEVVEKKIKGDFVECGVGAGAQIMAMKLALGENTTKWIFGFDSFEGIPLAGEFDETQPGIGEIKHDKTLPISERLVSSGITVHSKQNVENNLTDVGVNVLDIGLIKGWFQDTIPQWVDRIKKISLLRLDGDLYESTIVCLEYLYPKVSKGGVVIIDDYALAGARKAVHDYFGDKLPEIIPVEGGHGVVYFYKP